ncbi:hypothetical protein [Stenotrophomonas sp.]|uniref:hypothetical protein n=1 Tax=Stenotrophomonas sp. TaxID=69392 RepID=UPI0028A701A1|nr:hypothetical protein [Stenotrophomonas sp.]
MANKQRAAKPAQNDSSLPGTAAGTGPDAGTEASTGTGPDAGAGTGPDAATEASTVTGAAAGTEGGTSTSADAGTGRDAGTGTGTGTGTGSEDVASSADRRVRVRLLCTNHLGKIGDIVTVPTGHVDALRSGGLADPHPAALEAGE